MRPRLNQFRWMAFCLLAGLTVSIQCAGESVSPSGSSTGKNAGSTGASGAAGTVPIQVGSAGAGAGTGGGAAGRAGTGGAPACSADIECGQGKLCMDARCAPVECAKDDDCGSGQACVTGRCAARPCNPPKTHFAVKADAATAVNVAGAFNGWSPTATPMLRTSPAGAWSVDLDLAAGAYPYKFVISDGTVDAGAPMWIADPNNPATADDGFGGVNSLVTVGCDGVIAVDGGPPTQADEAATGDKRDGGAGADAAAADVPADAGGSESRDGGHDSGQAPSAP